MFKSNSGGNLDYFKPKLKIHKCIDEDYDSFWPPYDGFKDEVKRLKQRKAMWCIDDGQELSIICSS